MKIQAFRLYRAPEVAKILGIPASRVREFLRSRQLYCRRPSPSSHPRVPGRSLIRFIEKEGEQQ